MKTKIKLIPLYAFMIIRGLTANSQIVVFDNTYGNGSTQDFTGECVQQTTDAGFIVAGSSSGDLCLIKTSSNGALQWINKYSVSTNTDAGFWVQQTTDGGYIACGTTNPGANPDVYLLKVTSSGSLSWSKTFGGAGVENGYYVKQTSDGGYAIIGNSGTSGYIIKTNNSGTLSWAKTYAITGSSPSMLFGQQTADGGFICTGNINSKIYLLKTDGSGNVQWSKSYGGTNDYGTSVQQTTDGGYVITGGTYSYGAGGDDIYLIKTTSDGSLSWNKAYGTAATEGGNFVLQTNDGGYLITGNPTIKTNSTGTLTWYKSLQNTGSVSWTGEGTRSTSDGGYVITGYQTPNFSNNQMFLIKTFSSAHYPGCKNDYSLSTATPSPTVSTITTTASNFTTNASPSTTVNSGSATTINNCSPCPANAGVDQVNTSYDGCCVCPHCPNSCTTVTIGTSSSGYTYNWTPCDGHLSSCTVAQPNANPCVTTNYTLTVSGTNCATNGDVVKVTNNLFVCCGGGSPSPRMENSLVDAGINIFPNPSDGKITIESATEMQAVSVTDITGRVIYTKNNLISNNVSIDISKEPKGIYFIQIMQNGINRVEKITIE